MRRIRIRTRIRTGLPGARPDHGHTLAELIVAMTIFTTVLAIIAGAVITLAQDVRKTENLSSASDTARRAFARLDKQVRYASAINWPTLVGSDWYVEIQTVDGSNNAVCDQWRLVNSTDQLQQRSWSATTTPASAPSWVTVATSVVNDPVTQPPFTFTPASASVPAQVLAVSLVVSRGSTSAGTVSLTTSFAGRNTDVTTTTNTDVNQVNVSDHQVCQTGVGRP